jgi:hypothetical protein
MFTTTPPEYAADAARRRRTVATLLLATALSCALLASTAPRADAQGSVRTWVSGVGDDINPCSRTAPCKTLTGAAAKTASGGEINALDPSGFGVLTITKPLTVDLSGVHGNVSNLTQTGFKVQAPADADVVIRGVAIHGGSAPAGSPCAYGGTAGVEVLSAGTVRIDDTTISNQRTGVRVAATASSPKVFLDDVDVSNACDFGVDVSAADPGAADVAIRDTTLAHAGTALRVADRGRATIHGSTIFANTLGFEAVGSGVIDSYADNRVFGNAADGTPTRTLGEPQVGPTGPTGPTGPEGDRGPTGEQGPSPLKLVLAPADKRLSAVSGKRVKLRYAATAPTVTTLEVVKGRKVVATVRGRSGAGQNVAAWNGRIGRKPAAAGRYALRLSALSADGQTASVRSALVVRRGRP